MPKYYHQTGVLPKNADKHLRYKVVIYVNQKRRKVLYSSRTIFPARRQYREILAENAKILFPKMWDWKGKRINAELLLVGNWGERLKKYKAPSGVVYDLPKQTKDGFLIKEIQPYLIEEKFKYYNTDKMVVFKDIIKLMMKETYTKTLITFSNKVLVDIYEKDEPHLFILKNKYDAQRLYDEIKKFYYLNQMGDCFFFNTPQLGKELTLLYERLHERIGISRLQLRKSTTR